MQQPTPVKSIKIREAINMIAHNTMLLPDIQREYVWKKQDIELMFDSMLRGYPINTMMFWRVDDISNQQLDFYSFLDPKYIYGVTRNTHYNKSTYLAGQSLIVIDGQQRLTSIYIGLYGTYQTDKGDPKSLYLRLDAPATDDEKYYDFRFLSDNQLKSLTKQGVWFKMNDLTKPKFTVFSLLSGPYLWLKDNEFAMEAMRILDGILTSEDYLHYYDICGYNTIDDVLEVFTRTNNTGTPLSKGDLLLSALTSQWYRINSNDNARDYVNDIIDEVRRLGYKIDRDWVIKCCLVLFSSNIKMRVSNFSSNRPGSVSLPEVIRQNKNAFKDSVLASFELIRRLRLLEKGLSSKLAVIPIVQYIFEQGLSISINSASGGHIGHSSENDIQKWLFRAIVTNLFEAGTDDILTKIKTIVSNYSTKSSFPYSEIEKTYNQLDITDKVIDQLLSTPKRAAFPVLNIIFKNWIKDNTRYDMDHTHPEVLFKNLSALSFSSEADKLLANDGKTYNSVRNLQLLNESENKSKNKMPLSQWINGLTSQKEKDELMEQHCIPTNVSLDIADFKAYIDSRSVLLEQLLRQNLIVPQKP